MSAFDFATPGGVYPPESVPGPNQFQRLDVKQSKVINADDGGSYAPASPIVLGGSGISFESAGTVMSGGLQTKTGGLVILGTYDLVKVDPPRKSVRTMSLMGVKPSAAGDANLSFPSAGGTNYDFAPDFYIPISAPPYGLAGMTPQFIANQLLFSIPARYVAEASGPSFTAFTLNFRVLSRPTALPTRMRIVPSNELGPGDATAAPQGMIQFGVGRGIANSWAPSTFVATGHYAEPLANFTAPASYFKATTGNANTGGTEPTWNTTPGATTTDGGVVWTCIGQSGLLYAPTIDAYYNAGAPQSVRIDLDLSDFTGQFVNIDGHAYLMFVDLAPSDGSILYHSIQVETVRNRVYWP